MNEKKDEASEVTRIRTLLLRKMPQIEKKIEASKWYAENQEKLKKEYGGKFIAIKEKRIESNYNIDDLISSIDNPADWFIKYIHKERREVLA
jgi:hypothetical protein